MKRVLAGALIALSTVLVYKSYAERNESEKKLNEHTKLIQQEVRHVSKLVVSEGHFAEVYNYADSKELFGNLITADKKALIVVNAAVTIAYDLKQIDFMVDETNRMVQFNNLPQPEININPDIEYYDISADFFNPFSANDHNAIKHMVTESLTKKIESSDLAKNAENRLLDELSQLLVVSQRLGWTLVHNKRPLTHIEELPLGHQ